ncbi:MAG: carbon monoxide dehydrogenase subunit G [Chloroflexota bacterium]
MKIERVYELKADVQTVWDLLMNPTCWGHCIPGCDHLEPLAEDEYDVTMVVGIAAIKGTFHGTVKIKDKNQPTTYRLLIEGRGMPGFVTGEGRITLEAKNGSTAVKVDGNAEVGGTLAAVGQRLLQGVGHHLMDRFFNCVQSQLPS